MPGHDTPLPPFLEFDNTIYIITSLYSYTFSKALRFLDRRNDDLPLSPPVQPRAPNRGSLEHPIDKRLFNRDVCPAPVWSLVMSCSV